MGVACGRASDNRKKGGGKLPRSKGEILRRPLRRTPQDRNPLSDSKRGPSLPMVAQDRHASSHVSLAITATPPPGFFVSVASKGLSVYVSGLESTLAGISISVASKGVRRGMIFHPSPDQVRTGP